MNALYTKSPRITWTAAIAANAPYSVAVCSATWNIPEHEIRREQKKGKGGFITSFT